MSRLSQLPALAFLATSLFVANPTGAATATAAAMPAWEQLTPAQRDLLVAPIRERWNSSPGERTRMYQHAQRWQQMTPEQRGRAHHGMRRWEHMDTEKRNEMRALFQKMRAMTPQQRHSLRDQWHAMTPDQRKAWIDANPPTPR